MGCLKAAKPHPDHFKIPTKIKRASFEKTSAFILHSTAPHTWHEATDISFLHPLVILYVVKMDREQTEQMPKTSERAFIAHSRQPPQNAQQRIIPNETQCLQGHLRMLPPLAAMVMLITTTTLRIPRLPFATKSIAPVPREIQCRGCLLRLYGLAQRCNGPAKETTLLSITSLLVMYFHILHFGSGWVQMWLRQCVGSGGGGGGW